MAKNLEEAIQEAGSPVKLLWESKTPPAVVPRVVQEFSNWRDEQLAWRRTAVLFDQSHHMANLNIKGRDALKVISKLAVNSVANFPVDMAKQFVAVNHDGYVIGDNILFHLEDDEYQAVGIPPSINWLHYHATTGGYDVRVWRDDNSFYRKGDPVLYRYQVQGPGAMNVISEATGQPPPKLKSAAAKIADPDVYPSAQSDVAALMVLNHQTHATNLLTWVGWEARVALEEHKPLDRVDEAVRDLVDYFLFVDEAPLPSPIAGASGFSETFAARGPRDPSGRSLRQLDLTTRLMRYPCSYMIYSPAFDALPAVARDRIYARMWRILSGEETDRRYAKLSAADRRAVIEILRATRPALPAYFGS